MPLGSSFPLEPRSRQTFSSSRPDLSEESDFFDLGGDSLLITHLARRNSTKLGVRVPIRDMFAGRTLGRQAMIVVGQLGKA